MKKIVIPSLLAALLMVSCNKDKHTLAPSTSGQAGSNSTALKPPPKGWYVLTMLRSGWCSGYPSNCISIEPGPIISALKSAIDAAANSGSSTTVASTFNSPDFLEFNSTYLGPDATAKLTSGDFFLSKANDIGSAYSYMAGRTYPVTFDNMEFAFQVGTP